ncbi:EAL domain-containing protein [Pseudoalteromonas sp. T1lg65]|uniref:sensor domain-containing protein n=1 Tax=Pseudoalteromonas sp. T1lg65 TaxID=2077101 RepID=UPI003F79254D
MNKITKITLALLLLFPLFGKGFELSEQAFSQHSAVMLMIEPATGNIIKANHAAAKFYGYSQAQLETMTIQTINQFSKEQVANERQAALNEGRNYFIFQHQLANGQLKTVSVYSTPVQYEQQKLLWSVINDISQQRQLQQELWHYQANLEQQVLLQTEKIKQATTVQTVLLTAIIAVLTISIGAMLVILVRLRKAKRRSQAQGAKLSAIFHGISAYLIFTDENHHVVSVNNAVTNEIAPFAELNGLLIYDLFENIDVEQLLEGEEVEGRLVFHQQNKAVRISCSAVFSQSQVKLGYIYMIHDITDELARAKEERLASTVFATTSEGVLVADSDNRIQMVNRAFSEITGYEQHEVLGQTPALLNSGRHDAIFFEQMYEALNERGRWEGEVWNKRKNGEVYPSWLQVSVVFDEGNNIEMYVALFSDITSRKQNEQLMWQQANFDSLTGLANRHHYHAKFELALKEAQKREERVAICFIDLDRFKIVNDTLGHHIGDLLLKEAALRLKECVSSSDTVARLGGDEFALLLQDIGSINNLEHVASKILRALATPYHLEGHEAYVSGSMGITLYPDDGQDRKALLRNADSAMYKAKEQGRNCYQFFTAAMHQTAKARSMLESALHKALANRELSLVYQPIYAGKAYRELRGCEALLRWHSESLGAVSPEQFIPVCEELGLIIPVGEWVLYQACSQAKAWQQLSAKDIFIAVNVSSIQFKRQDMVALVKRVLTDTGLPARLLTLEITESVLVENSDNILAQLKALRALGVELAIDDFGTGYSSLSYLKRFPLSKLKIDRAFIRDLPDDDEDKALVSAIVLMAHRLQLNVIAEGVESVSQLQLLEQLECDFTQGFFHAKPMNSHDFENQLLEQAKSC